MALNKRERNLLVATIAILVIGGGYFLLVPLVRAWQRVGADLRNQRRELAQIEATVERAPQWAVEYQELQQSLGQRSEKFTTKLDVMKRIEEIAAATGVVISTRRELLEVDKGLYRELPVAFTLEATTESLVRFLYALQTGSGFMNVEQLQVTGRADNPTILRCDIQIRALAGKTGGPAA
jgi:BMFP domain-containing protein YqiC